MRMRDVIVEPDRRESYNFDPVCWCVFSSFLSTSRPIFSAEAGEQLDISKCIFLI